MPPLPLRTGTNMQTRTLLAVTRIYRRDGRVMIPDVALAIGRSKANTWAILDRLREAGLVEWQPYKIGTLVPCVVEVPINRRRLP